MDTYLLITHPLNEGFVDSEHISLLKSFYGKKVKFDENNIDIFYHEFLSDEMIYIFKNGEDSGRIKIIGEEAPHGSH